MSLGADLARQSLSAELAAMQAVMATTPAIAALSALSAGVGAVAIVGAVAYQEYAWNAGAADRAKLRKAQTGMEVLAGLRGESQATFMANFVQRNPDLFPAGAKPNTWRIAERIEQEVNNPVILALRKIIPDAYWAQPGDTYGGSDPEEAREWKALQSTRSAPGAFRGLENRPNLTLGELVGEVNDWLAKGGTSQRANVLKVANERLRYGFSKTLGPAAGSQKNLFTFRR